MISTLSFYIALQLFAFAAWPLLFHACSRLRDRGYAMAKVFGVLLVTYLTWLILHSPLTRLGFDFSFKTVALVFLALVLVSGFAFYRRRIALARWLASSWRGLVVVEMVFVLAFTAVVTLRAHVPHISYHMDSSQQIGFSDNAAEKFTDFAILNSLLTSPSFPPHDAWVAGENLNYYYFGHLMWATMIHYTSVSPSVGFNLALAGNFALIAVAAYGLGWNLTGKKRYGLLTTFFVSAAGNLDGFLQLFSYVTGRWFQFESTQLMYLGRDWWRNFDYWRSSRAVENTITEFPAFSTVLGDLHAHYLALPILIAGMTLCVQLQRVMGRERSLVQFEIRNLDWILLMALVMGALSAANSWDVITLSAILGATAWSARSFQPASSFEWKRSDYRPWAALPEGFIFSIVIVLLGVVVLFYPFLNHFQPPRQRPDSEHIIPGLLKWVAAENKTAPLEFFSHWLLLMALPAAWLIKVLLRRSTGKASGFGWFVLAAIISAACLLRPMTGGWVGLITGGIVVIIIVQLMSRRLPPRLHTWMLWMAVFFTLATVCEFVYIDDIFSGTIERINTVFKVYYGMWVLAAACAVLAIQRWFYVRPAGTEKWVKATLLAAAVYPIFAVPNRVATATRLGHWEAPAGITGIAPPEPWLAPEAKAQSLEEALDGLRYHEFLHPDDAKLMAWLGANTAANARIMEYPGSQYTYNGRVSTLTGRPAVAGWLTHSWAWRGHEFGDDKNPNNAKTLRDNLARNVYNTTDTLVFDALDQMGVDYIIYGEVEQAQVPQEAEFPNDALLERYDLAYQDGEAMVLKRRENNPVQP